MDASDTENKKRPLPVKDEIKEPESKKVRVDHVESSPKLPPIKLSPMLGKNKPQVTRTLKVIPPKDPGIPKDKVLESYTLKVPKSEAAESNATKPEEKTTVTEVEKPKETENKEAKGAEKPVSPEIKVEEAKENEEKPKEQKDEKEQEAPKPQEKEAKKPTAIEIKLSKMELDHDVKEIISLLDSVKNKLGRDSIIINDKRLCIKDHPNSSTFLGHVNYTGAKSRTAHSNRAVDLDLFLIPQFTEAHHFATLEVRIPAEFLSYRGNIAVRKSAIWVIIHSGHYRPVDAPDPSPLSVEGQNAVNQTDQESRKTSTIVVESPIITRVIPIIAQADPACSSSTILVPDHDLLVTLRILPKLLNYAGSTRFGLDSNGWGSTHDGQSVRVERVEKVPRGTVTKLGRKASAKRWGDVISNAAKTHCKTIVFSNDGSASIKYSPDAVNVWPTHLRNILEHPEHTPSSSNVFTHPELEKMKDCDYWKLLMTKYQCKLQDDQNHSYTLAKDDEKYQIMDANGNQMHSDLSEESISWTETGLVVNKEPITVKRLNWIK
ncbi:hypothetical protein HDV06_003333 [Boothiomyces sp. JEL0866]|nr:hypothetical protein HDV06_003333 [Boothiomyces sp. JEL0866]